MGIINAEITTGTPPYSIVVRKTGEITGNRCVGACNNFPVSFIHDAGNNSYYFIVTDSTGCVKDSRNGGGTSSINCDVTGPNYNYELTTVSCDVDNNLVNGNVRIYNIQNATRYKLCYGSTTFNCTPCTDSTGILTPGVETNIPITPANPGELQSFSIRIYNGTGCDAYSDISSEYLSPICASTEVPDFAVEVIQPACSAETGGVPQPAKLKLTGVVNATRYKLCYNSTTFNSSCVAACSSSDGVITGNSAEINITAPSEGLAQAITIRVFNGTGCSVFKDYTFNVYTPKCSSNELTLMNLDLQVFQNGSFAKCTESSTYQIEYDFYITPNTPGVTENGQQVKTGSTAQRTLPAGNDVPNTFIVAGFRPLCSSPDIVGESIGSIFYRFTWNMTLLKAKYPAINEFIFDVYALRTKLTNDAHPDDKDIIRPRINAFTGVAMIKQFYSNGGHNAYRNPPFGGFSCMRQGGCGQSNCCPDPNDIFTNTQLTIPDVIYKGSVTGSRKIGSVKYNYTTNKMTWTEFPQ